MRYPIGSVVGDCQRSVLLAGSALPVIASFRSTMRSPAGARHDRRLPSMTRATRVEAACPAGPAAAASSLIPWTYSSCSGSGPTVANHRAGGSASAVRTIGFTHMWTSIPPLDRIGPQSRHGPAERGFERKVAALRNRPLQQSLVFEQAVHHPNARRTNELERAEADQAAAADDPCVPGHGGHGPQGGAGPRRRLRRPRRAVPVAHVAATGAPDIGR